MLCSLPSSAPPDVAATDLLLDAHNVLDVLLDLESAKASGVLEVRSTTLTALIYLKNGVPVFAEQGSPTHSIGRTLLRQGVLTDEQHRAIIEHMTDKIFESEQLRLGEVAVKLGFVTSEQVNEALHDQVRQRIMACIAWEGAAFRLYRNDEATAEVVQYPCPVGSVIGEAVALYFDDVRVEQTLRPFWSLCPRLVIDADEAQQRFKLPAATRSTLTVLQGASRVAALLRCPDDARQGIARALVTLTLGRALAFEPRSLPEATINEAVRRTSLISELAPEPAFAAPIVVDAAPGAFTAPEALPARTVPRHLLGAALRAQLRSGDLRAEQLFREGKRLLAEPTALPRAARALRKAAELAPTVIEYSVHAAWAELLTEPDESRATERRRSLAGAVDQAISGDARFAFGHYVRGRLLHMDGRDEQALSAFRSASELDPSNAEAARFRKVLQRRQRET